MRGALASVEVRTSRCFAVLLVLLAPLVVLVVLKQLLDVLVVLLVVFTCLFVLLVVVLVVLRFALVRQKTKGDLTDSCTTEVQLYYRRDKGQKTKGHRQLTISCTTEVLQGRQKIKDKRPPAADQQLYYRSTTRERKDKRPRAYSGRNPATRRDDLDAGAWFNQPFTHQGKFPGRGECTT